MRENGRLYDGGRSNIRFVENCGLIRLTLGAKKLQGFRNRDIC